MLLVAEISYIILGKETRPNVPEVDEESQLGIVLSQLLLIPGSLLLQHLSAYPPLTLVSIVNSQACDTRIHIAFLCIPHQ